MLDYVLFFVAALIMLLVIGHSFVVKRKLVNLPSFRDELEQMIYIYMFCCLFLAALCGGLSALLQTSFGWLSLIPFVVHILISTFAYMNAWDYLSYVQPSRAPDFIYPVTR